MIKSIFNKLFNRSKPMSDEEALLSNSVGKIDFQPKTGKGITLIKRNGKTSELNLVMSDDFAKDKTQRESISIINNMAIKNTFIPSRPSIKSMREVDHDITKFAFFIQTHELQYIINDTNKNKYNNVHCSLCIKKDVLPYHVIVSNKESNEFLYDYDCIKCNSCGWEVEV